MSIQCPTCLTENPDNNKSCFACGTSLVVEQNSYHLSPGTILAHQEKQYKIEKTLGVGGFGITYKGIDIANHDRPVAIKENWPEKGVRQGQTIVWPASVTPQERNEQINKIIDEAKYIHRCRHPHIVEVYDWFTANNTAYIIMEFLPGKSLADLLQEQGKLPETKVKKYLIQVAQALKLIHSQNMLHRDIKPGNIMITTPERAVLIDFGNARAFIANKTQRMTQIVTPGYAPLEQYSSKGRRGAGMDIYSLCASMYELLTGQLPVAATDRVNQDTLIPPHQIVSSISPVTEKVILTGLKMRVEERFASADDLIAALQGNWVSPALKRARLLVQQKQLSAAVQAYQKCGNDASHQEAAVELAMVLMHIDDTKAANAAQQAIQVSSSDGRAYGVLGLVYCRQGKWSDAVMNLQTAERLSPNEAWIQANFAWSLGKVGNWQQAAIAAQTAIKLDPNSSFILGLQAWISVNLQQFKPAIRYARQALFQSKQSRNYQDLASWVYPCLTVALDKAVITQQAPDVERCLQQFSNDVPTSSFLWGFKGWKQAKKGLYQEALISFKKVHLEDNLPGWILLNQGIVQEYVSQKEEAIKCYKNYHDNFTESFFTSFRLGTLLAQTKQWSAAHAYLEKTIKLQPDLAEAHHNLGWILLNIRNKEGELEHGQELLDAYRRAVELYQERGQNNWVEVISQAFREVGVDI